MTGNAWENRDPNELFKLVKRLDSGASGQVWLGKEKETGKKVAVKIISLYVALEDEIELECQALAKCDDEYVTKYYGAYFFDDSVWIVMEYIDVSSLLDLQQVCLRPLSEEELKAVCAAVLKGLKYMHEKANIIHRDIKAKNILIHSDGRIKLADLGVAAILGSKSEKRKTTIGSPHWMAPEVIIGAEYDGRADIWGLGITILELAEFEPPYADLPIGELLQAIPLAKPPTFQEPSLWSDDCVSFLEECLVKDPAKRKTAAELLKHPFVAAEVSKQQNQDFSVLAKMVEESANRVLWLEDGTGDIGDENIEEFKLVMEASGPSAAHLEHAEKTAPTKPSVSSKARKSIARLRKSMKRLSVKKKKAPKDKSRVPSSSGGIGGFEAQYDSGSEDEYVPPQVTKGKGRKSRKLTLMETQLRHRVKSGKSTPLSSDVSQVDAKDVPDLSPEEIAERERKAEEIKKRLFRLYDKFSKDEGTDKFENFGKVS